MKVVINNCFGGFGLSAKAVKRIAELRGKEAYFFKGLKDKVACSVEEADSCLFFSAYTVPNPPTQEGWHEMTMEERKRSNEAVEAVSLDTRPDDRSDPMLVQVVEELGEAANGKCAELKVVEIPDGIEWEIDEYDGLEHVAEKHRTWR